MDRRNFIRAAAGWLAALGMVPTANAGPDPLTVPIHRAAVESTHIASIGFSPELQVLEIEFKDGTLYRYFAVPPSVFDGMRKAASKGRFFSENIRSRFSYKRLADVNP